MTDATRPLTELQDLFLASSTQSMPVAGMTFWAVVGIVALFLEPGLVAYVVLFGSGMIFPVAILIDRATGKRKIQRASAANPLLQLGCRGPERAAARRRPGARLLCRLPAGTGSLPGHGDQRRGAGGLRLLTAADASPRRLSGWRSTRPARPLRVAPPGPP